MLQKYYKKMKPQRFRKFFNLCYLNAHPVLPLLLGHFLDGVTQSRAWHFVGMLLKEVTKKVHRNALAHLAEHPAHRFVHKVMRMV